MIAATLEHELAAHGPNLPGSAATRQLREAALAAFAAAGLPTTRHETWRYTDLQPLAKTSFELVPAAPSRAAVDAAAARLASGGLAGSGIRLVFVDGHLVPELGHSAEESGLEIGDLRTHWTRFETRGVARANAVEHPLAGLNTAFAQQGAWIRVREGARIAEPVQLVFIAGDRPGLAPQPRIVVELGRGAELTVVEQHLGLADAAGWLNGVTEIALAAGARLAFYRLQEHGAAQFHTALLSAELAANAALAVGYVDLGGRLVRNDIDVKLREPGASVQLFGVFVAAAGQHVDDHTRIDHIARETRSDETFRGIIARRGRGVFNGKVVVHRDAQRIDARQSNDNLLLSDQAEIDTKPELEIYADDVKCSHGATVGELDAEQLFYLRARGLSEPSARELLTTAFAASVLERIDPPPLREQFAARVAARLGEVIAEAQR